MYKTRQELFDMAYKGLRSQGFEKSRDEYYCRYRGPDGKKCALGWCIPDGNYSSAMEGFVPSSLMFADPLFSAMRMDPKDVVFASTLQDCHDCSNSPDDMNGRLKLFAMEYGLKVPE